MMPVKRVRRFLAVALLVVAALLLASCGGSAHRAAHGDRVHAAGFGAPPPGDFGLRSGRALAAPSVPGYDAVTIGNIPVGALAVGCYASGHYVNCTAARARFPHAHIVTIATWNGVAAKCLDVEPRDAVPSQVPGWIHTMIVVYHVYRPCVYSDASEWKQIGVYLAQAHIVHAQYLKWLADWDGIAAIPVGYDGKQWMSNCCVDRDMFATYFFATAPAPKPKPKPVVVRCLRKPFPRTTQCRRVRYGYNRDLQDWRKLDARISRNHCTARKHPRYCGGWLYWDRKRAAELAAFNKTYA